MPTKEIDNSTGRYRVAFRLPPEASADQAWVAADFNDWSIEALPMERQDDGAMVAVVEGLEPGTQHRFRYYLGDGRWENDWAADAYVDNEFGGADSLLVLPETAEPPAVKKAPAKKATSKKAAPAKKAAAKKAAPKDA